MQERVEGGLFLVYYYLLQFQSVTRTNNVQRVCHDDKTSIIIPFSAKTIAFHVHCTTTTHVFFYYIPILSKQTAKLSTPWKNSNLTTNLFPLP